MAFGGFDSGRNDSRPVADINVVPLIDVMLVLLVIFMITAPLFSNTIPLDLPNVRGHTTQPQPETVHVAINAQGEIYWNNEKITETELGLRITALARKSPSSELHLSADKTTRYEPIAKLMAAAQQAGLNKIAFVTHPSSE